MGICAQKLWVIAEPAPSALQPGWEDKPSSVRQQQLEKKGNRTKWNLYPRVFERVACGQTGEGEEKGGKMNREPNIQKG